jgi:hypothetical protein
LVYYHQAWYIIIKLGHCLKKSKLFRVWYIIIKLGHCLKKSKLFGVWYIIINLGILSSSLVIALLKEKQTLRSLVYYNQAWYITIKLGHW